MDGFSDMSYSYNNEKPPSFGSMLGDRGHSQPATSNSSYNWPPSHCEVVRRGYSHTSESTAGGQDPMEIDEYSTSSPIPLALGLSLGPPTSEKIQVQHEENAITEVGPDPMKINNSSAYMATRIPDVTVLKRPTSQNSSSTFTKVSSVLVDDGHVWRKYGQKEILKSRYPRNYFRCSHRYEQGCRATKQVQQTNEDPPNYKITYHGLHTCSEKQSINQIILDPSDPTSDNSIYLNFENVRPSSS